MRAFCINLDSRTDRREYIWSEFQRLRMDVERIPAVDGSLTEIAAMVASLPPGFLGDQLGTGAYACFQSHRLCWQRLIESGARCAMVMEDDLVLADGIVECLTDDWVPEGADVVKLETRNLRVHLSKKKIAIGRGRHVSRLCSTFYGAACYVITSDAARRLLHVTENCVDPVDVVLCDTRHPVASTLSVYQMSPAPAVQGHLANWKKATGTWTQSSIDFRWKLEKPAAIRRETSAQRLNRRFKEEVRAFFRGTRYVVIPHG